MGRRVVRAATFARWLGTLALLVVSSALAVAFAELAMRLVDGFELSRLRLMQRPAAGLGKNAAAMKHLARLPVPEGVDARWFEEDPAPLPKRPRDPQLDALFDAERDPVRANELTKLWNREFVLYELGSRDHRGGYFAGWPDAFFVFAPPEKTPHPRYRFAGGVTSPNGLSTNRLGFRGPEIQLDKPRGVVRIAFAGASTTQGAAGSLSYPEHVAHWLNLWLASKGTAVHVDVINAGREGLTSPSIAAIVRQELLPLEPDLVVYYEGSNQFGFRDLLVSPTGEPLRWESRAAGTGSGWLATHSALVRSLSVAVGAFGRGDGREVSKPDYVLEWPAGLDEQDPDLSRTDLLPAGLRQVLSDLDSIRGALGSIDTELALCSFAWLVREGMVLDPLRDARLFEHLNRDWWPYRYRDMRRMADFQNRVLRKYARVHGVTFLQVAEHLPEDAALFADAIHTRPSGTRLRAWVTFLELLPWLEERLGAGTLPRPDARRLERHPSQARRRLFAWGEVRSRFQQKHARREATRQGVE